MKRLFFLVAIAAAAVMDSLRGRSVASNNVLTPFETSRGTQSMSPDVAIGFFNSVVKVGSSDRNCTLPAAQTDVPLGILLNDAVTTGDIGSVRKNVALFGVYPETLPGVATGAIAAGAEVVADLTTPGNVKQLATAAGGGTFLVFGRARFAVAQTGDPVSIIHCVPRAVTF